MDTRQSSKLKYGDRYSAAAPYELVAEWHRQRIANPFYAGSNPVEL